MTTTWFSADLHLGHKLVSGLRGFGTTDEHDHAVLGNLSHRLARGDSLWVLGDISSGTKSSQLAALARLDELVGDNGVDLHFIAGNHDGVHPLHRNSLKWDAEYRKVFQSVQPFARRRLAGQKVWLSHFPWRGGGDHTESQRYETVRLNDDGTSWLLHGHTHSSEKFDPERRMIQVGLDAWDLEPVSIHAISDILEGS